MGQLQNVVEDGTLIYLPVANIRRRLGFNPRRYFDDVKMNELVASVRTNGVVQPIVVRPVEEDERYEIIAGERRWRAAQTVGLSEIPAVIRDVSEVEAIGIAIVENTHRDDLGPSEEAQKARDYLTLCDGDRDEVCRRLGWNRRVLDRRLSLLNCTSSVLAALDERTISIGHGELLATLPAETQDGTLPKIIEQHIPVSLLRERIQGISKPLKTAYFPVDECDHCEHNSTVQASLFEANIGTGKCSNPRCYGEKTLAAMAVLKVELEANHASVWLDTERAPDTYAVLEKDGPRGVGSAQLDDGCKQCAYFGVVVATAGGHEGQVTPDICFDLVCHKQRIAAFALLKEPKAKTLPKGAATQGAKEDTTAGATPKKVTEVIDKGLRRIAGDVAADDPAVARAVRLYALWRDAGFVSGKSLGCNELPTMDSMRRSRAIVHFISMEERVCTRLEQALTVYVLKDCAEVEIEEWSRTAAGVITKTETALPGRFRVGEELLRAHKKTGMVALLREAGYETWYDAKHGEGQFAKFCNGRIDVIVSTAMEESDFDWSTFVPEIVIKRVKKLV